MDHVASRVIKSYTHTTKKSTKIGIQVVSSFPWVYIGYPCGQGQVVFPSSNFCMLWEGQAPQPIPSFSPSSTAGSPLAQHCPFAILTAKVHVFAFSQFHPQLGTREEGRRALPLANHFCQPCTCSVQCFFCPCLAWGGGSVTRSRTGHRREQCSQGATLATRAVKPLLRPQARLPRTLPSPPPTPAVLPGRLSVSI